MTAAGGAPPDEVLAAWGLAGAVAEVEAGGLINRTYLVRRAPGEPIAAVVQRLHPIFGAEVNVDVDAVTRHLAAAGMETPRLLRTVDDRRWIEHAGAVWRALSYVEGVTVHRMPDAAHAAAAGELVGRFHRALAGLRHRFVFQRAGVHDTLAHLDALAAALRAEPDPTGLECELRAEGRDLGRRILAAAVGLPALGDLPQRPFHGDLKVSNVRFAGPRPPPRAVCLLDLDTLGPQVVAYELGDALRSWCNRAGEDSPEPELELEVLEAAMRGYAAGAAGLLTEAEVGSILPGLETTCVELAARFCRDVFEDRYFGWTPGAFTSRRHHNLVRARGQLALAIAVAAERDAATDVIAAAFAGAAAAD